MRYPVLFRVDCNVKAFGTKRTYFFLFKTGTGFARQSMKVRKCE